MPDEHEARLEAELVQLRLDIKRLGEQDASTGTWGVKFGVLFDDEAGQNFYEALVGTLKAAKKRKIVDFEGQMLLKGMSDQVVIKLLGE